MRLPLGCGSNNVSRDNSFFSPCKRIRLTDDAQSGDLAGNTKIINQSSEDLMPNQITNLKRESPETPMVQINWEPVKFELKISSFASRLSSGTNITVNDVNEEVNVDNNDYKPAFLNDSVVALEEYIEDRIKIEKKGRTTF